MVLHLSSPEYLLLGLHLSGFSESCTEKTCEATNLRCFHASFGISPMSCKKMFQDLQTSEIATACINNPNPAYFMMSLNWLCSCKIEEELAGSYKMVEKTA
jgi:hypothetical protein